MEVFLFGRRQRCVEHVLADVVRELVSVGKRNDKVHLDGLLQSGIDRVLGKLLETAEKLGHREILAPRRGEGQGVPRILVEKADGLGDSAATFSVKGIFSIEG